MSLTLRMVETSTVSKASAKFYSLRTTIPRSVAKQWELKEGDKLNWTWKVEGGEMILILSKRNRLA